MDAATLQQQPPAEQPPPPPATMAPVPTAAPAAPPVESQTVGVFLEEIAFFLEDMERDIWWLLRAAHQQAGVPAIVRGDEELQPVAVEEAIERLRLRAEQHAEQHANQVRAKIIIVPAVVPEERAVLNALRTLKFHCRGKIEVFQCMKEANNSAIWAAYFNCVASMEPHWMVKTDGPGTKLLFAQCAVVVPVYVDRTKQEIKLFTIWCPEKKKRHWAFPGGDILRGCDGHLYDTARREFQDEVGIFFGRPWHECFVSQLPANAGDEITDNTSCLYVQLEKDGHRYPARPHIFAQVTEDFYEATRAYEDASGVIRLPQPAGDFVRWDELASARRVHVEGVRFVQHEEASWVKLEFTTGKITADDGRQLRKENAELFRQQPDKIWQYLAELVGLDPLQKASHLPSNFPTDGPFSVRMSGIDKTATDEDISQYFEDNGITVKKVEQFSEPRHTARIDFTDKVGLELALQLSGRNLLRRKVKVELWADGETAIGGGTSAPGAKPLKPYEGPLSEEGPWKVYIRGLDKSVTRDDLGYFFWDRECQVKDVDYPVRNERHAGLVEFKDVDSLRSALGLNHAVFKGREISIEMPTGKEDRPSGGGGGGGGGRNRGGGGRGRGGGGHRDDGMGGYGGHSRFEREPPSRAEFGSERPKLQLQPRSKPLPGEPGYREELPRSSQPSGRTNPFGNAQPRDDRFKPTRADGDDNWRR